MGSDGARESPFKPGDDLGREGTLTRSPLLVIARDRAQGSLVEERGSQTLRTGRQGLRRIGFTRKGRAAQLLERVNFLSTLLEQLLVHRLLRMRVARR